MKKNLMPSNGLRFLEKHFECDEILINYFISDITGQPPIKILNRIKNHISHEMGGKGKYYKKYDLNLEEKNKMKACAAAIKQIFGYNPLKTSFTRVEPILFNEKVSVLRKKYPKLETIIP